ncbi:MAG: sulfurtransferase TusA family protein [Pseudomonadota bacterium]
MTDDTIRIDATGLLCPLPVLKLARKIRHAPPGAVVELLADDPAAVIDVPHYCTESGHTLIETSASADANLFRVRKTGGPPG